MNSFQRYTFQYYCYVVLINGWKIVDTRNYIIHGYDSLTTERDASYPNESQLPESGKNRATCLKIYCQREAGAC